MTDSQPPEMQPDLGLDDSSGLRITSARFIEKDGFDWGLLQGYDSIRIPTYSASIPAIVRMLDDFGRRGFDWEDVPSILIDEDASGGGRTVLHRSSVESFLGRPLKRSAWWRFQSASN